MKMSTSAIPGVVVITGASAGVGRAIVHQFARAGWRIGLIARDAAALEQVRREVEELGGIGAVIPADVSDAEAVFAAADSAERSLGPIDVWINDAMVTVFAPVWQITPEEFRRVTEVTYLGVVHGTMAALKRMKPRDHGSIVLVGSALAYRGIPLQSAYCGAKHGIEGFYDSLRCELLHDGSHVRTCMVQLPAMNTTQFGWVLSRLPGNPRPMGKIYQPEVAARAILFAAAHNRRSLWVGGSTYKAIIGNKIAPSYADRVLARTGYGGQQTDEHVSPDRQNNVWKPVEGDRGMQGGFSGQAANKSVTLWAAIHRGWLAAAAGGVAIAGLLWGKRKTK